MRLTHGRIRKDLTTHVVVDVEGVTKNPSSCPICSHLLRTADDISAIKAFGCCDMCASKWARPDKDRWFFGWRPPHEEVEKAIHERPPLIVAL